MAKTESIVKVVAILFAVPTCAFGRSTNDVLAMFKPIRPMNFTPEQMKLLEDNRLTQEMWPFLNITAVEELYGKKRDNESDVITDEDVADIPDDDDHPMPNTVHYDGQKTTVTISTEGAELLFQHWIDQAVSGLMSAVATKKFSEGRFRHNIDPLKFDKAPREEFQRAYQLRHHADYHVS